MEKTISLLTFQLSNVTPKRPLNTPMILDTTLLNVYDSTHSACHTAVMPDLSMLPIVILITVNTISNNVNDPHTQKPGFVQRT